MQRFLSYFSHNLADQARDASLILFTQPPYQLVDYFQLKFDDLVDHFNSPAREHQQGFDRQADRGHVEIRGKQADDMLGVVKHIHEEVLRSVDQQVVDYAVEIAREGHVGWLLLSEEGEEELEGLLLTKEGPLEKIIRIC